LTGNDPPKAITLVSAFGRAELILEYLDFFNGGQGFSYSPEAERLRKEFAGSQISEVHLICTKGVRREFQSLTKQVQKEYESVRLCSHFLAGPDITSNRDEEEMRDLVYGLIRKLVEEKHRIILSSGGRKTMTNRLIEAGLLYGCEGYLAITAPELSAGDKKSVRYQSSKFNILWLPARRFYEERYKTGTREGIGDNFRSLYLLPISIIDRLNKEMIGLDPGQQDKELAWLRRLPKADLHCHLGGAFDPELLGRLARCLVDEFGIPQEPVIQQVKQTTGKNITALTRDDLQILRPEAKHCLENLGLLLDGLPLQDAVPALVSLLSEEQIRDLSWDGTDIHECKNMDLDWYMTCGDLGGSAVLQSEACLRMAFSWLLDQSWQDGVRYLEVRCSPANYCKRGLTPDRVIRILRDEGTSFMRKHPGFKVNLLIMATRHKPRASMAEHVSLTVAHARQDPAMDGCRIVGFDLAGQERDHDPLLFQDLFLPLHLHFINITIHAGEMEDDNKIWQALYLLHAKRIGHGLKLINNPQMMDYVRDYGTALEMCPSSNRQTNGFSRSSHSEPAPAYPLKKYLDHGIRVTVNTDNPGISSTTLSREYLAAAQLTKGGLSRWDILKLIKNSFRSAFLAKDEKDGLLKNIDQKVFDTVMDDYFPEVTQ